MKAVSYAPTVKAPRGKGPRTNKAARKRRLLEEARRTASTKSRLPSHERG